MLVETQRIGWSVEACVYRSLAEFNDQFPALVRRDGVRVLKQYRGNSGQGVYIDGIDAATDPLATKRRLAYIPEQLNLYGHFSGVETLAYFAELGGHRYTDAELRTFLRDAGLQAEAHDPPRQWLLQGHAVEGGHRHRPGQAGQGAAARRTHERS